MNIDDKLQPTFSEQVSPLPSLRDHVSRVLQIEISYKKILTKDDLSLRLADPNVVVNGTNLIVLLYKYDEYDVGHLTSIFLYPSPLPYVIPE